jgi:hypothetical protein
MDQLPDLFSGPLGLIFVIVAILTVALWWLVWLFVPFFIYGMSRRLKDQLAAQHETNRLLRILAHRDSPGREESEDARNPFR